jgi:lycopene beta-cyclase
LTFGNLCMEKRQRKIILPGLGFQPFYTPCIKNFLSMGTWFFLFMCTGRNVYFSFISFFSMVYDFAIIGAGAAGLHVALAMLENEFFAQKKILILDKEEKTRHDITWCFWEKGTGKWDDIVSYSWESGAFISSSTYIPLKLPPYQYKMIRSEDFYALAKKQIRNLENMEWKQMTVEEVRQEEDSYTILSGEGSSFMARFVLDSRIDSAFFKKKDPYFRVWQHFKGWVIETQERVFDPETFTMMDFRAKHQETTSFIYILPTSQTTALVEFTLFSPDLLEEKEYDDAIETYLTEVMLLSEYKVLEEEKGVIPMTDYPFHLKNTSNHVQIGTAGSWVKPSSGYSFKNSEKNARRLVENLHQGKRPDSGIIKSRFRLYDTLFLDRLYRANDTGEDLFVTMYSKNHIHSIFKFLDEETTFIEDLRMMSTFKPWPFIGAIYRRLIR